MNNEQWKVNSELQNFTVFTIRFSLFTLHSSLFMILTLYWLFLTYMLLSPPKGLSQELPLFEGADKVVHVVIFAVLSFLYKATFSRQAFGRCFLILILYGIATELAQEYMHLGRSGDPLDLLADTIGIVLGYRAMRLLAHKLMQR